MRLRFLIVSLFAFGAGAPAAAQPSLSTVAPGTRIRVTLPQRFDGRPVSGSNRWITGTLSEADTAQLTIRRMDQEAGTDLTVRYGSIGEIQVSNGSMRSGEGGARGALRGAIVGGALFGTLYALRSIGEKSCDHTVSECDFFTDRRFPARVGPVMIGGGALIGFAIGSRSNERWTPLRNPRGDFLLRRTAMSFTVETRMAGPADPRRPFTQPTK